MKIAKKYCAVVGFALTLAVTAQAQNITLSPQPPLPFGTIGGTYLVNLSASGGTTGNYVYSISAGQLPPGLQLSTIAGSPTTARISGFPTTGGTYNFTLRATDNSISGQQAYSIGVMQILTPSALPDADAGTPYSLQFQASDAPTPYNWSAPGAPPGLTMSPGGLLSGTPQQVTQGTPPSFNVTANAIGFASATKAVTLRVFPSLQVVTGSTLNPTYVGTPFSIGLTATGGKTPYVWSLATGPLPDGLTISSNGLLSGTPKTPSPPGTPFNFRISVRDANNGLDTKQFFLTVYDALSIATPNPLPSGALGQPYTLTFQGAGGLPPYTFGIVPSGLGSGVPAGLTLTSAGVLSGTPTFASSFSFILRITDANQVTTQSTYNISITQLNITTQSPLAAAQVGRTYTQTFATTGGTAPYTYTLTGGSLPPGISLSPSGVLSGTPSSAGTFGFTITSTDALQQSFTKQFQLPVGVTGTVLQVDPGSIRYNAISGGDSPPPQFLEITGTNGAAINFTITVDNGSGGAAPPWITVFPLKGVTPARVTVMVDPLSLAGGTSSPARIRIGVQGSTTAPLDIPVTITVVTATPDVIAYPTYLRFEARIGAPKTKVQSLRVINRGGGGPQPFQMSVVNNSPWLSLTPPTGTTTHNVNAVVLVKVNTQGLAPGLYRDAIHFVSPSATYDIPVSTYVAPAGAILKLSTNGLQFQVKQGAGGSNAQTVKVLNVGDPGTSINFRADILQGGNWFTISPSAGVASPSSPGIITVVPGTGAQNLPAAGAYALVRITDVSGTNSPQYLTAVLDVLDPNTPSAPDLSPTSLVFRVVPGAGTQTQQLLVYTSDLTGAPFQASANSFDGGSWLSVSPTTGTTSTRAPGRLTVNVNPAGLANGIYRGELIVSMAGGIRVATVTLIVANTPPISGASLESTAGRSAAGQRNEDCTPSQLVVTNLNTAGEFFIKAGWPVFLLIQVFDDCNGSVQGANVVASFSNGDLPLSLFPDPDANLYTGVWQPGSVSPSTTVAFSANLGDLSTGGAGTGNASIPRDAGANVVIGDGSVTGEVTANPSPAPPPFLNACGTVNNTNVIPCGGLAPGTVSSVYGQNLASAPPVNPNFLPLPTSFNGTQVLVGGIPAPMFYLGPNQINIQVPTELVVGRQYQVLVTSPGGVSATDPITIVPASPGIATIPDGLGINAQHGNGQSVTALNPARRGETIAMYLTGMGVTNPLIATGAQAPGVAPLPVLQNPPTVTVDGQNATVAFSGLTPGGIGLYQINFTIPAGSRVGEVNVVVTQNNVSSNITRLNVSQ